MRWIAQRIGAFFRWLCSTEQLPATQEKTSDAKLRAPGFERLLLGGEELDVVRTGKGHQEQRGGFWKWVLSPQGLPRLAVAPRDGGGRPDHFWSWVWSADELGEPGVLEDRVVVRTTFWRWIRSTDPCPRNEVLPSRRRGGFLHWLVTPEACPTEQAPAGRQRRSLLSWLLSPDKL